MSFLKRLLYPLLAATALSVMSPAAFAALEFSNANGPFTTLTCPSGKAGAFLYCGRVYVKAVNASHSFSYPSSISSSSPFGYNGAVGTNTCRPDTILSQGGTCFFEPIFTPNAEGTFNSTVTVKTTTGNFTFAITGTATPNPFLQVTPGSPINCPNTLLGESTQCAEFTITARYGSVTLWSTPIQTNNTEFTVPVGTCTPNKVLAAEESCTTGRMQFTPSGLGSRNAVLTINSNSAAVTRNVSGTGTQFTYSWAQSGFGSCEGGEGEWAIGGWMPISGCGSVGQSRSVSCSVTTDSGVRTQTVTCQRSDGQPADESMCAGARPASSESCTPGPSVCGEEPEGSRTTILRNECPMGCAPDADNNRFCVVMPI